MPHHIHIPTTAADHLRAPIATSSIWLAHSLCFSSAVRRAKDQPRPTKPGANGAAVSLFSLRLYKPAHRENHADPVNSTQPFLGAQPLHSEGKNEHPTERKHSLCR